VYSLKMAALEKIDGWTSFDKKKDLGGLVHAKEIGDGLLGAVVEQVEVFAAHAADELAARIGDDDADVDAIHADANVGSGLGRLLRKSGRREQENARDKKGRQATRG
jgi:hypothetical protein